jgi:GNAT superfamily N-acetyltransferase
MSSLAIRVADSIATDFARRDLPRIGPFTVLLNPTSPNIWRNYAVPDAGAEPSDGDVLALIEYFRTHGRVPRLEYVPAAAPGVEPALLRAGFRVGGRPPLMACRPGDLRAATTVDGITLISARTSADLMDTARAQDLAYGSTEPTGPEALARLERAVREGDVVMLARDAQSGAAVGGGQVSAPVDGVSELAAIGVVESHRRRGIASALVATLTTAAHDAGAQIVWLEPAGAREQAIYERAGFQPDGTKLWISLSAAAPPVAGLGNSGDHAGATSVRLRPVDAASATAMLDGGLQAVPAAPGWPHQNTMAALWMVAHQGAELWLVERDGLIVGEVGTMGPADENGVVQIGHGFAPDSADAASLAAAELTRMLTLRPGVAAVVDAMTESSPDTRPPRLDASETETLLAFIGYLRTCLIGKVAGVSEDDARHSPVGSGTCLLGLLKHVAHIEVFWLHQAFAGGDGDLMPDDKLARADTVASVTAAYEKVIAASDEIVRSAPSITARAAAAGFDAEPPTLRWILTHLVEEIGRHAGHADIVRELIDGSTGR